MLLILFGDIGVGKTTVAKALVEKLHFQLVQFDSLVPPVTGKEKMYGDDGSFLLSDQEVGKVHAAMREGARAFFEAGENVILESMYFNPQRVQAIALAEVMGVPYRLIEVVCDEDEVKKRIGRRLKENSQSAGVSLFLENKGALHDELREHILLDTTGKSVEECAEEVIRAL